MTADTNPCDPPAGPELDALVAEAIGWFTILDPRSQDWWSAERREWPIDEFAPSTDWNAAMAAAERVGLFEWSREGGPVVCVHYCLRFDLGQWQVFSRWWEHGGSGEVVSILASAPTGPLAICRAILKLKEKGDG